MIMRYLAHVYETMSICLSIVKVLDWSWRLGLARKDLELPQDLADMDI